MPETASFESMTISGWRQFSQISISFHPRLTILTGENATGKSTLLGILAQHLNWNRTYSYSPPGKRGGLDWAALGPRRMKRLLADGGTVAEIGRLRYRNASETSINVPTGASPERLGYDIYLPGRQDVSGVFLGSHRAPTGHYTSVPTIPTSFSNSEQLADDYAQEIRQQWQGQWSSKSPQLALKEALIAAAVFGGGQYNEFVDTNREAREIFTGFQKVLKAILPSSLGFRRLRVRGADLILETTTGDFIFDEASGGVAAIIDIAWQIFLRSVGKQQFTVLLDEPENHLHPGLQRELLPALLRAFPEAQFIVATHSPFVVTSTPDSSVYVLRYDDRHSVTSRLLDYANKAASADDTLTQVLGLPSTLPIWAERRFDEIIERHLHGSITEEQLSDLRAELSAYGLERDFPAAVLRLTATGEAAGAS